MKIYLSSAVTLGRKNYPKVCLIEKKLKKMGHRVFGGTLNKNIVPGENLDPKALYQREVQLLDECDMVIAEVTDPSWGAAFLMEYALRHRKPVLALFYKAKYKNGWPAMIQGHPDLFSQAYNDKNLDKIIENHLDFIEKRKERRGFFIALEGVDGSGKTTQVGLLLENLKNRGKEVKLIDFPRYYSSFHGEVITRLLRGEFGQMNQLNPYLVSLAYALDRLTAKDEINNWLNNEYTVLSNRYTGSNMAHQAAKLKSEEQLKFVRWVEEMEYQLHKIPRENMTIFLDVPVKISQKLVEKKSKRAYLKWRVQKDIAEKDLDHQNKSYEMYRKLCRHYSHWYRVNCVNRKNEILSADKIHKKIMKIVNEKIGNST